MATNWTYDATQLENPDPGFYTGSTVGERFQVRMLIQDVTPSRPLFWDEEIDWQLTKEANVYTAAAVLCETLVMRGNKTSIKSKKVGGLAITYDVMEYVRIGASLRARGAGHQIPYCGGISKADKSIMQQDNDATKSTFQRGMEENTAAPQPGNPPLNPLTAI